jgi:hypothetical protein
MQHAPVSKEMQIKFESENRKKRELGRLNHVLKKIIQLRFGKIGHKLESSSSGQGQVAGSCESGVERCPMNCGVFLTS